MTVRERQRLKREEIKTRKQHLTDSLAEDLTAVSQLDHRYPLEQVENTGQSVPGARPARNSGARVSSLTQSFADNQHLPREKLSVRKKVVRNGTETYEKV